MVPDQRPGRLPHGDGQRRLGHPVHRGHCPGPEPVDRAGLGELLQRAGADRLGAVPAHLQARQVEVARAQPHALGGEAVGEVRRDRTGGLEPGQRVHPGVGAGQEVFRRLQDELDPVGHAGEDGDQAHVVVEGQPAHVHAAVPLQLQPLAAHGGVGEHLPVRERDRAGQPGGARGELQVREVVGPGLDRTADLLALRGQVAAGQYGTIAGDPAGHEVAEGVGHHHAARVHVVEPAVDLGDELRQVRQPVRQGQDDGHGARPPGAEQAEQETGRGRGDDRDAVAPVHARPDQPAGHPARSGGEQGVGQRGLVELPVDDGDAARGGGGELQHLGHGHRAEHVLGTRVVHGLLFPVHPALRASVCSSSMKRSARARTVASVCRLVL